MFWLIKLFVLGTALHITRGLPLSESSNEAGTEAEREKVLKDITKEILLYMDDSIDPCEDFYAYVCNNFEKHHPIPSDRSTFTVDTLITRRIEKATKKFVQAPPTEDPDEAGTKVKLLYQSCLDRDKRNEVGVQPLLELINTIGGWHAINESVSSDSFNWLSILSRTGQFGVTPIVNMQVTIDYTEPDKYVMALKEDNSMYPIPRSMALSDPTMVDLYKKYVLSMLLATGLSEQIAVDVAEDIVNFSVELMRLTIDRDTVKDQKDISSRLTVGELQSNFTEIDWTFLLETITQQAVEPDQIVVVMSTPYYSQLPELLRKTSPKTIVNYLFWRVLRSANDILNEEFSEIEFQFTSTIYGTKTRKPMEDECFEMAESKIGRPVQAFFIQNYFDKESKTAATEMTNRIQESFRQLSANKEWVDAETMRGFVEKLDNMFLLIGYPEGLLSDDYVNDKNKDLKIVQDNYFQSSMNLRLASTAEGYSYLRKRVDKCKWAKSPTLVNAFYSRLLNVLLLPAGNLQPPFYHRFYPQAINYGAMGMIIGHEITHGFDKSGRDHDSQGRRVDTWTAESARSFDVMTECFVEQYSQYRKFNISNRGRATQDENISDSGGIRLAYKAYLNWLVENQPSNNLVLPDLEATDKQLFFIAYAHSWCEAWTDSAAMQSMLTDTHSLAEFRIRGSLSNMAEFSDAFNCPIGSPMNPEKKCVIW